MFYANNSVKRILKGAEAAIRQQLPNFDADNMAGVNIDTFHKNPAHQADLLASFHQHLCRQPGNQRALRVSASPVINDRGERMGAVAEWLDRTSEILVEKEVANIVDGASQGAPRWPHRNGRQGGILPGAGTGHQRVVGDHPTGAGGATSEVLSRVSQGDLTQKIEAEYQGIFGQLKDDTNTTIERLREVVGGSRTRRKRSNRLAGDRGGEPGTCRAGRKNRRAAWKRPRRRWKN